MQPARLRAVTISHEVTVGLVVAGPKAWVGVLSPQAQSISTASGGKTLGKGSSGLSSEAAQDGYHGGVNHTAGLTHTVKLLGQREGEDDEELAFFWHRAYPTLSPHRGRMGLKSGGGHVRHLP